MAMAQHGDAMDTSSQEDSPSLGETLCQMLTSPDKKCAISAELMSALKMNTSSKQPTGTDPSAKVSSQTESDGSNSMPPPQMPINSLSAARSPGPNAAGKVVMSMRGGSPQQHRQVAMSPMMAGSPGNQQIRGVATLPGSQQNVQANSQVILQGQQVVEKGQTVWRSPGPRSGQGGQIRGQGRGHILNQGMTVAGDANNTVANQGAQILGQSSLTQPGVVGVARGNVKAVNRIPMTAQDLAQLGSPGLQQALLGQGQGKVAAGKRVIRQMPLAAVGTTMRGGVSVTKMAIAQPTQVANVVTINHADMNKTGMQNVIHPVLNKTGTVGPQTVLKTATMPGVRSVVRPAMPQQQFKAAQLSPKMAAGLGPNQPRMTSHVQPPARSYTTTVVCSGTTQTTTGLSMSNSTTSQLSPEQLLQLQQLQQRHLPQPVASTASSQAGMPPANTTASAQKSLPLQGVQNKSQPRMTPPGMLNPSQMVRPASMSPRAMAQGVQGVPQGPMQQAMLRGMKPLQQQQQAALGNLLGNLGQANLSSMTQAELLQQLMDDEDEDDEDEDEEEEDEDEEEEMMDKEEYYLVNDQFYISRADIDQQAEENGCDATKFIENLMRDKVGPGDLHIERTNISSGAAHHLPSSRMSTESMQILSPAGINAAPRSAVAEQQQGAATAQPQASMSQASVGQQQQQQQQQQLGINPLVQQAIMQAQKSVGMQPSTPAQANQSYTITQKQATPFGMRLKIRAPAGVQQPRQMIIKANMPSLAQSPVRRGVASGSSTGAVNTPALTSDITMVNQVGSSDEARNANNKQSQQSTVEALVQSILNNKQDLDPILSNVLAQLGQADTNRNQARTPAQPTNASRFPPTTSSTISSPQSAAGSPGRAITNVVSATGPVASTGPTATSIVAEGTPPQAGGSGQEDDKQTPEASPGASGAANSKYVKGCEYSILYSTGVSVRAIWDGNYFKLKPKNDATATSAASSVTTQAADSTTPCTTAAASLPGAATTDAGQVRGGGGGGNKPPQPGGSKTGQEGPDLHSSGSNGSEDMELELPSNKRPLKVTEAGKFAVCVHCGSMSANYNQCDQCHKTLPDEPRFYYPGKVAKIGESETAPDAEAAARQMLVERVVSQALAKANMGGFNMEKSKFYGQKPAVTYSVRVQGAEHMPRIINRAGRHHRIKVVTKKPTRPKRPMEPEMVEISSDDEDEMDGDAGSGGPSESPGSSRSGTPNQMGLSRRERMEDEHGQVRSPEDEMEDEGEDLSIDEPNCVTLEPRSIRIGSLRLNNFSPVMFRKDGIFFTVEGPSGNTQLHLEPIMITQIMIHPGTRMPVMFLQTTSQAAQVVREKCNLKALQPGHPYFDPTSSDETHRMIVILLNALHESKEKLFRILVDGWPQNVEENTMTSKVLEIDFEDANAYLTRSVPTSIVQQLQNPMQGLLGASPMQLIQTTSGIQLVPYSYFNDDCDESGDDASDRSRSPSPPISGFSGTIVKLFTYPPPPATGGITCTNEDLFCLNEGEFLNDVIIDFYLKYLFNEIMSAEDRARTHIFSSFFYRRLSQRNKGRFGEEDCKMTPQQRRHTRVKTWTRHVDLFAKDFVIVPINESAHWYLAIICFPGMRQPEYADKEELNGAGEKKPETASENGASKSDKTDQKEDSQTDAKVATSESKSSVVDSKEENGLDAILKKGGEDVSEEVKQVVEKVIMEKLSVELKVVKNSEDKSDSDKKDTSETSKDSSKNSPDGETEGAGKVATENAKDDSAASNTKKPVKKNIKSGNIKRQPCILIFDSLSGPSRSCVIRTLRDYIAVEWDVKKSAKEPARTFDKDNMRGANPRCPQQTNYSDCGVYLLQYVESFFEQPITCFNLPMKQLQHWFPDERVRLKRVQLRELILSFQKKLNPKLQYDPTKDIIS